MKLERVDVMFLHNAVTLADDGGDRLTTVASVVEAVAPAFERLIAEGRIGCWGLTGISQADALIHLLENGPAPGLHPVHLEPAGLGGRAAARGRRGSSARHHCGGQRQ